MLDKSIRIPEDLPQTNQTGEIISVKLAVTDVNPNHSLTIYSDSKTTIDSLTRNRQRLEDTGYIGAANAMEIQSTIAALRERNTPTTLKWVKGHSGVAGNEKADELAKMGCEKTEQDEISLQIQQHLRVTGAKLSLMTQARAYKAIRQFKKTKRQYQRALDRRNTRINTGRAKSVIKEIMELEPSSKTLWKSLRHKDFSRKFRYFIWMVAHEGYKIGDYWQHITNFEHRANCHPCGVTESMDHILTECQCPGQQLIWELTREICTRKGLEWNEPSLGLILGAGIIKPTKREGRSSDGDARFLRIVISESAHLIWKIRCERVIKGRNAPSHEEITRRWKKSIEARLELDHLMITTQFRKRCLSRGLVKRTWKDVISDEDNLPDEWMGEAGVLVGIRSGQG
ncbi:RNase H-domain-containing protein [Lentinula raphanica]|nr:RNase H-domain-containing protein [Lentinula raphanica]